MEGILVICSNHSCWPLRHLLRMRDFILPLSLIVVVFYGFFTLHTFFLLLPVWEGERLKRANAYIMLCFRISFIVFFSFHLSPARLLYVRWSSTWKK